MPKLEITGLDGRERTIEVSAGVNLMEAIRDNGFDELQALCGGSCACATCHVYVASEWLSALPDMGDFEDALLDSSDNRQGNSRLSCQIEVQDNLDGIRARIAPEED